METLRAPRESVPGRFPWELVKTLPRWGGGLVAREWQESEESRGGDFSGAPELRSQMSAHLRRMLPLGPDWTGQSRP